LITVLMIFVGGAVAGMSGLMLVLPLLGVVMVVGKTVGSHRHRRRAWSRATGTAANCGGNRSAATFSHQATKSSRILQRISIEAS
jgi:hypothetical protein